MVLAGFGDGCVVCSCVGFMRYVWFVYLCIFLFSLVVCVLLADVVFDCGF